MISVRARFDGNVFIPEEPVDLPPGSVHEISIVTVQDTTLARLARIADEYPQNPNAPDDLASQHDHYLYGTCKKP